MSQGEKPAYQERSRATREKIVAALDEALKEKPFDQVSVAELAERAGVAVGTVYRRFENKDALIPVILEIYKQRLETGAAGGAVEIEANDDLREVLRTLMQKAWAILAKEAHLLRAVHLYARLKPELTEDDSWDKYEAQSYQGVEQLITHYADHIKRKDLKRASAVAAYFLNAIFLEKGLYPTMSPASHFRYSGKTLADEAADMVYAYLQLPERA